MGLCVAMFTLGAENIRKVLADPPLILKVIARHDPDAYEAARGAKVGFFARLFGRKIEARAPVDFELDPDEVRETDMDKAWHGIHYLLTGTADGGDEPLNFVLAGGTEVNHSHLGYDGARVFTPEQVGAIDAALRSVDDAVLRSRFNPAEMTALDIYPSMIWNRDPSEDDALGYCLEHFQSTKAFIAAAVERRAGLVFCLV